MSPNCNVIPGVFHGGEIESGTFHSGALPVRIPEPPTDPASPQTLNGEPPLAF